MPTFQQGLHSLAPSLFPLIVIVAIVVFGSAEPSYATMDPPKMPTNVVAVGGMAVKSLLNLHITIRGLRSQEQNAKSLKDSVKKLNESLGSLLKTIVWNPDIDFQSLGFQSLEPLLERCSNACNEYSTFIAQFTKKTSDAGDWITQKYIQRDANDFKNMITAYHYIIDIASATANLRIAEVSPGLLEDYMDMNSDVTTELNKHLQDLQQKIDRLETGDTAATGHAAMESQSVLEEEKSIQQGLKMCVQLGALIDSFESSSEHSRASDQSSADSDIKAGPGEIRETIQSLVVGLQTQKALVSSQMGTVSSGEAPPEPVAAQLARLQQIKDSVGRCIQIMNEAGELANERRNFFEKVKVTGNAYAFPVSTLTSNGGPVTVKESSFTDRSRFFGGQASDNTVVKAVEAFKELDMDYNKNLGTAEGRGPDSTGTFSGDSKPRENPIFNGPGYTINGHKQG
ncbi:hypothetical protein EsH8_I_000421 [Colletotrichum jinshuiense]